MRHFRVVNWEKHQHYKDRSPPWIKLQNRLLDHYEFGLLKDASKAHLIGIWLLASRHNNKLPFNAVWIGQRIQAVSKVQLEELQDAGFIELYQDDSILLADSKQSARLEGETEREREVEKRREKDRWVRSFDSFWEAYPKRKGKEAAKKAWAKLAHEGVELQTILTALEWQTLQPDWIKENRQFMPLGSTYLNNKRWEDEYQPTIIEQPKETETQRMIRVAQEMEAQNDTLRIS